MTKLIQAALCASVLVFALAAPATAHAHPNGGMRGFMHGLNGVLTAVADPFAGFADPPSHYDALPLHQVTGRVFGFVEGVGLGVYRATMGVVDMVAAPLFVVPQIGPKARFEIFVGDAGVSGSIG
jgi:hypothetical protein